MMVAMMIVINEISNRTILLRQSGKKTKKYRIYKFDAKLEVSIHKLLKSLIQLIIQSHGLELDST